MSDTPSSIFGRNLRAARLAAGLSQQDVEKLTGMPQTFISTLERGAGNPTLDTMTRLAAAVAKALPELLQP